MRTIDIPGTGLRVSAICLGGGPLGSTLDRESSFCFLDAFVAQGGNFIDTAKIYADWLPGERSISEKMIGAWLSARGNRAKIIIGTKGAHPDLATMHIPRLSPEEITSDLEASLRHLQSETIDLYWLHRDDPSRPAAEIIETLNRHVIAGKIRYFGCSNWRAERVKDANAYAARHNLKGFSANQMWWSLAEVKWEAVPDRTLATMDLETLDLHKQTGLAAIPYSAQANGFYQKLAAGAHERLSSFMRAVYLHPTNTARLQRILKLAQETGWSITQITLGYLVSQPFTTIPIVGCHTHEQLADSLSAAEVKLTPDQVSFLEG